MYSEWRFEYAKHPNDRLNAYVLPYLGDIALAQGQQQRGLRHCRTHGLGQPDSCLAHRRPARLSNDLPVVEGTASARHPGMISEPLANVGSGLVEVA